MNTCVQGWISDFMTTHNKIMHIDEDHKKIETGVEFLPVKLLVIFVKCVQGSQNR